MLRIRAHGGLGKMMRSVFKRIRVRKEDSAFFHFILESYEGIASYSTLQHCAGDAHRDLELRIPPDFVAEVEELLRQMGDMIYELKETA
jgi:hypothetical protein